MRFWPRLRGLLLAPRATWAAIAAAEAPRLSRAIPLLLLPWLLLAVSLVLWGMPVLPERVQEPLMMQRPDGTLVQIGIRSTTRPGARLGSLCGAGLILAWLFAQRGMILGSAARYLGVPDRVAAFKLAIHAPISLWLVLCLLPLSSLLIILVLPAMIHTVVLAYLGAPLLLPPQAGQESRFARSIAFRTVLIGLATLVAYVVALKLLTEMLVG